MVTFKHYSITVCKFWSNSVWANKLSKAGPMNRQKPMKGGIFAALVLHGPNSCTSVQVLLF